MNAFSSQKIGICNFGDDTATYISDESFENVLKSLEKNSMLVICWFENNYIKLNIDKCHMIGSGYKHEQVWTNIGKDLIWESKWERFKTLHSRIYYIILYTPLQASKKKANKIKINFTIYDVWRKLWGEK